MSDTDHDPRILELRRLVRNGEYRVDAEEVAACLIRKAEQPDLREASDDTPLAKVTNSSE